MKNQYAIKKLSDWWLDLSKITIAAFVIKVFEPGGPRIESGAIFLALIGLFVAISCARLGLKFAAKVRE